MWQYNYTQSSDELYHWRKGYSVPGAKYRSRKRVNGKWVYDYSTTELIKSKIGGVEKEEYKQALKDLSDTVNRNPKYDDKRTSDYKNYNMAVNNLDSKAKAYNKTPLWKIESYYDSSRRFVDKILYNASRGKININKNYTSLFTSTTNDLYKALSGNYDDGKRRSSRAK